jgi:hypothetical protein
VLPHLQDAVNFGFFLRPAGASDWNADARAAPLGHEVLVLAAEGGVSRGIGGSQDAVRERGVPHEALSERDYEVCNVLRRHPPQDGTRLVSLLATQAKRPQPRRPSNALLRGRGNNKQSARRTRLVNRDDVAVEHVLDEMDDPLERLVQLRAARGLRRL